MFTYIIYNIHIHIYNIQYTMSFNSSLCWIISSKNLSYSVSLSPWHLCSLSLSICLSCSFLLSLSLPLSFSASLSRPFSHIKIGFRRIVALSFANFSTPHTDAHCVFMGGEGGLAGAGVRLADSRACDARQDIAGQSRGAGGGASFGLHSSVSTALPG